MKLLIPLIAIGAVAGAEDKLRGRELKDFKSICIWLGNEYGYQTFEVPTDKYRFYTSTSRKFPAKGSACDPDDVKDLSSDDLEVVNFCRLFDHNANEWLTVQAIRAAEDWMGANGFDTGACTNKNTQGTIHMDHLKEVNEDNGDNNDNEDDWDILFENVTDWLYDFTYDELIDVDDCLAVIWDGDYTSSNRSGRDRANRDTVFDEAVNLLDELTIDELNDALDEIYAIYYGERRSGRRWRLFDDNLEVDSDYTGRTCRSGDPCTKDSDCGGGSCQDRNNRRK